MFNHITLSGFNKMYKDAGNNISREDYPNGCTLYAFDITPDLNEDWHPSNGCAHAPSVDVFHFARPMGVDLSI